MPDQDGVRSADRKPFNSIEEFLFAVLTLRNNLTYREDFGLIAFYDNEDGPGNNWAASLETNDRVYRAARNLIGTWELICRVVKQHYSADADLELFFANAPVANMYARLHEAIQSIRLMMWKREERKEGQNKIELPEYAPHFAELGKEACKRWGDEALAESASDALAREYYRTAEKRSRATTHFG